MPGARLSLAARNNTVLAEARTDEHGIARFAPGLMRGKGGNRPVLLTARTEAGDYNFLRLDGGQLDLSDRASAGARRRPARTPSSIPSAVSTGRARRYG